MDLPSANTKPRKVKAKSTMKNLFNGPRSYFPLSIVLNRLGGAIHSESFPPVPSSFLFLHLEALVINSKQSGFVDVAQSTAWSTKTLISLDYPRLAVWRARQKFSSSEVILEKRHNEDSFLLVFHPKFIEDLKAELPAIEASRAAKPRQRAVHRLANMLFGANFSDQGYDWFDGNHAIREVKKLVKAKELGELGKWRKDLRRDPLPVSDVAIFDELKVFRSYRSRKHDADAKPEDTKTGIILNIAERLRDARNQRD